MKAGSGIRAKPCDVVEVSMAGLSLKRNSEPSRAPAASIIADSMRREVSENSRSAVSAGPSSESASTVRNSRRKLFVCTATTKWRGNQSKSSVTCPNAQCAIGVLVSLMR